MTANYKDRELELNIGPIKATLETADCALVAVVTVWITPKRNDWIQGVSHMETIKLTPKHHHFNLISRGMGYTSRSSFALCEFGGGEVKMINKIGMSLYLHCK